MSILGRCPYHLASKFQITPCGLGNISTKFKSLTASLKLPSSISTVAKWP